MKTNNVVYKLIHSQEMVQYMWRYTLHMQATQIPCAVAFDEELDFNILARAVNEEIKRNDCLRLRLTREIGGIREYFLDSFKLDKILLKSFSTKEEQEAFLDADASKKLDVFGGETFRVIFFRSYNGKSGIYINVSHMIMDGVATFIFFRDLMEVYDALKSGSPMPRPLSKYEDIIKREQNDPELEARLEKEAEELNNWVIKDGKIHFSLISGDKVLNKHRRLLHSKKLNVPFVYMPLNDKTHFVKMRVGSEESGRITRFIEENHLSPEWVIQLGFRIMYSKLCDNKNDTLFWVLCPRRKTVKEKRCGGTLASPMPWREVLPNDLTFFDAVKKLAEDQAFLFRYSDVPFTTVRANELKHFRLTLLQSANSMMFSYLPLEKDTFGNRSYEYLGFNFGHYVMPIYTITMRDHGTGDYVFSYIHRLWLSEDKDVYRFHEGALAAILKGIENPEKTVGEILEEI